MLIETRILFSLCCQPFGFRDAGTACRGAHGFFVFESRHKIPDLARDLVAQNRYTLLIVATEP